MVKISPDTSLMNKQSPSSVGDHQTQESQSCPNFAQKMCLSIEFSPAQEDHFKTPLTKTIKKDAKHKASVKTIKGQHSPLSKIEQLASTAVSD